ncbi:hypothetical protein BG000_007732, partial [Podila horticola]
MNRAFDIVSLCEWIMKNTPRIDADSLANIAEASDPSIGADDRSTDSASFSMSPILVESHPFPLNPKAHAQNPEPTPSQYLISEFANFPDEILADNERDDEINHQQSHIAKRTLSRKKSTRNNKAKDDHPLTQYTVRFLHGPANVLHPQQAKGVVSGSVPSRIQNLISLFEKPFWAPIKCSESFSSSDSAYESGTITADIAMSSHSRRNGLRSIFDGNDTSELTPSTLVKTSSDKESTIHDKSSSMIPLQTLHITRNTALEQALTVLGPTNNITLHRKNSHLAFLASIHTNPAMLHKFYWMPSSSNEIETFNLGLFQSSALSPYYFHQDTDTSCYGFKSTVAQLGSLPMFRPLEGDDDKVLTEFDEPGFCACCDHCTGSARFRQQGKIHQISDPAPRPPPRPLTPYPRPVRPPPRPVRPHPSPIPWPDAHPAPNFSFGDDTVHDSMSNSDSDSDTVLNDVFEFFSPRRDHERVPHNERHLRMSKEQVQQITAKAQRLDGIIKSLFVQLADFVVQRQDSDDSNLESESGSLEQLVD